MTSRLKYDVIAVLGNGFTDEWCLPDHMKKRMDVVAKLHNAGFSQNIVTCGRWSINYDRKFITPPTTESALMADVLQCKIPSANIMQEDTSKDSLGNAYFLKTKTVQENNYKHILVVCGDYQEERVQFLFRKVFGDGYTIDTHPVDTPHVNNPEAIDSQRKLLERQKEFLQDMRTGDHTYLEGRLYDHSFYKETDEGAVFAMGRKL